MAAPARPRPAGRGPQAFVKALAFSACLLPLAWIAYRVFTNQIRGDWVDTVERETGRWAIRFLAIALAVTPARRLLGWGRLGQYRRMLGLFAFFYATVHLLVYFGLDLELYFDEFAREVAKRKYLLVGMTTWLLLLPLAVTSTKGWTRRLGGRRWNRLHRLVYVAAITATVHYLWAVKKDTFLPAVYVAIFAILLAYRLWARRSAARTGG
ncbi:MAG: sulfite oxidase heme-binding subunit YedZ [Gemmatimonadaceae bacterium]